MFIAELSLYRPHAPLQHRYKHMGSLRLENELPIVELRAVPLPAPVDRDKPGVKLSGKFRGEGDPPYISGEVHASYVGHSGSAKTVWVGMIGTAQLYDSSTLYWVVLEAFPFGVTLLTKEDHEEDTD